MTESEKICNEIGEKIFSKDFVYENLMYFNKENNKSELCDALFEYGGIYLALQIKERKESNGKSEETWMEEVVYTEAVNQIIATIDAIRDMSIEVSNLYHQKVEISKNNQIFPLVVFENERIKKYKKIVTIDSVNINIMSIDDYKEMMNVIMIPYDIFNYLLERSNWLNKSSNFPNIIIGENINSTTLSLVKTEYDFSNFFKLYMYDGDMKDRDAALKILSIIKSYKNHLTKKGLNRKEYRKILLILQLIRPENALGFIERFEYAWKQSCQDKFDFTKAVQLIYDNKKTSIVFFSVGKTKIENARYYEVLCDAKQLQQKSDAIILIVFAGDDNNQCQIDWIYYERKYVEEPEMFEWYNNVGIYNGIMDKELFTKMCEKLLEE